MPAAPIPVPAVPRRALLAGAVALPALAGCGTRREEAPAQAEMPTYRHLTPLRLNVAEIEVGGMLGMAAPPVGTLRPEVAVAVMGRERLLAAGPSGRARFVVETADLRREPLSGGGLFSAGTERLTCLLRARVEVLGPSGERAAFAEAQARREWRGPDEGGPARARAADALLRQAMAELNVEFEYQVRRNLRPWLLDAAPTQPAAPRPEAVGREELPRP